MKVADVMTRELITINANERARNALRLMEKEGVSRLLVEKKKKIVGIVTLRDLMRRLGSEKERKISDAHIFVSSCYSKDLIKISPQESIEKAAKMMIDNDISSLVVEENGEVVGIVTKTDLLKVLKNDSTPVKEIMQKKVRTSVLLDKRHIDYLKKHPELNLSGFVRKALDELIAREGDA